MKKFVARCSVPCPCGEGRCDLYAVPGHDHECERCYELLRKSIELRIAWEQRRKFKKAP